jgi:hypothetical protein
MREAVHLITVSPARNKRTMPSREIGGAGYSQLFEAETQPCSIIALTACTPNLLTLPIKPADLAGK